ncbi:MAG: hypothetical protein D6706_12415 [Chloroflexi bacterium]|nr:MAG: hypothetical protein D6706_12415 [Chloroflexota bacterium]
MRLDKKHEEELARRKGMARKTFFQTIWLIISGGASYFALGVMEDAGWVSVPGTSAALAELLSFIPGVSLSASSIPDWFTRAILIVVMILFLQTFFYLGYAFASPAGRRKAGSPTVYSQYDPFDRD